MMPLLRRKKFSPKPLPDIDPDSDYFVCKATGEVFEEYEEFYQRVIVCNSLVWSCGVTGRPNLTYSEAIAYEEKALAIINRFPQQLRVPTLHLATLTYRTRINDMNEDVYVYIKDIYFKDEIVEAIHEDEWWEGKVVDTFLHYEEGEKVDPEEIAPDEPDWDHIRYRVRLWDDETSEYIAGDEGIVVVDTSCIRREKNGPHSINQDKVKMFLKYHCEQVDFIWRVKKEVIDEYQLDGVKFSDHICLVEPKFPKSKTPAKRSSMGKGKSSRRTQEDLEIIREAKQMSKESSKNKQKDISTKVKKEAKEKMTPEQKAAQRLVLKERLRVEREKQREEAAAKLLEEKVRLKELREQERVKAREEKRVLADKKREWNKPRDDLLCDDLVQFPSSAQVPAVLDPYFGEIVMIVEFLSVFGSQLGLENSFPDGVTIEMVEKALFGSDINGPLSDLLCFFLAAIFNCIEEEEMDEEMAEGEGLKGQQEVGKADLLDDTIEPGEMSYKRLIENATSASQISQLTHGTSLKSFQLDPLTVSEVLRLHLLASGAKGSSSSVKFRYQSRGGYTSLDDAGIELKKDFPHILSSLATGNVFDLDIADKLRIISTLITQLLTYASIRDVIEESIDQYKSVSYELKQIQWAEQRREREETQIRHKKRLEQRLHPQHILAGEEIEKMDTTGEGDAKPQILDVKLTEGINQSITSAATASDSNITVNEEAAKEARKIAKKILNDTAKLDPNRIPQDTGRSRRKNAPADDFNWREYDMTDWNNLEEKYISGEDLEVLNCRRKEIETRRKQDYLDKEAEMHDNMYELSSRIATHPLGQDRWGRYYWSFNSIPNIYVQKLPTDVISQPTELDASLHSEKENVPSKQEVNSASTTSSGETSATPLLNGDSKSSLPNTILEDDPSNSETTNWVYYNTSEEMDELVSALNTRGHRESTLKVKVLSRRRRLQQLSEQQPEFVLGEHSMHEMDQPVAATHQNIKSRSRIAKGLIQNTSAQESLELNLREMLLDLEERVFVGALGSLKVANRAQWREALESGGYSPQDKQLSILTLQDIDPDDGDSLVVRDLLRALLQIQRAIEPKFLCKPLGSAETDKKKPGPKKSKKEEVAEAKDEGAEEGPQTCILDRWTDSLLNATSLSQIFLHMCTLESSIVWSKSALNARCRLCRRKGDGEKMLLCDMCDRGHHMYCLKPPVKDVPRGDWYCPECRPKQVRSRKASRRKSFYEEEESNEGEDEETQADDSVYDEETASSSEEEPKHPKIKLLRAGGSGRSSPVSLCSAKDSKSRRSRTNTPEVDSSRFRRSAAPSPEVVPAKKSKTSNRHSEGSRRQSKGSRAASPSEGSNRSSVGSARANLSEEVAQLAQCEEIVRVMVEMDDCWPFLAPVSKREVPDYYAIIKQPMDCQTILSKYKTVKYTHVSQMIADVRQMFTNCSVYNVSSSSIYKMGERLSRFFEKQLKALRLEGNSSKRSRRT